MKSSFILPEQRAKYGSIEIQGIRSIEMDSRQSDTVSAENISPLQQSLERGAVLHFPKMGFEFLSNETRFLSSRWSNGKSKNINLRSSASEVRGLAGSKFDQALMKNMLIRYGEFAETLIRTLFPAYSRHYTRGGTSFRPCKIDADRLSWRKDDTRLHVDAFPSNPNQGVRLLRVFTNVNPDGLPRVWRTGEPFRQFAGTFLPKVKQALPGSAWLLHKLGITKSRRSEYDHVMLQLHDLVKADLHYQQVAPQLTFAFPAGATWIVFTDQVLHAAMTGQFAFEQTFYLNPQGLTDRDDCPLDVLEALTRRRLVSMFPNDAIHC